MGYADEFVDDLREELEGDLCHFSLEITNALRKLDSAMNKKDLVAAWQAVVDLKSELEGVE